MSNLAQTVRVFASGEIRDQVIRALEAAEISTPEGLGRLKRHELETALDEIELNKAATQGILKAHSHCRRVMDDASSTNQKPIFATITQPSTYGTDRKKRQISQGPSEKPGQREGETRKTPQNARGKIAQKQEQISP